MSGRAANDPAPNHPVSLGDYYDVDTVASTALSGGIYQRPHVGFPMEKFVLQGMLAREYLLGTIPWTTSQAAGTLLFAPLFPEAIFYQPFIADKIKDFLFFRAGIRITIRVTTNRFLYGRLITYFTPMVFEESVLPTTVVVASGSPHVLTSAMEAEATTFDVPFIHRDRVILTTTYATRAGEMGGFNIMVLNPLTAIQGDAASVDILVTAQFLSPELYLPNDTLVVESHSEAMVKSEKHSISSSLSSGDGVLATITSARQLVRRGFSSIAHNALSEVISASMLTLGLSIPTTLDQTAVCKVNPFHNMSYGEGIDTSVKLALSAENGISTMPDVGGIPVDEMELSYFVGTPMLTDIWLVSATTQQSIATVGTLETATNFFDIMALNFRFWSGSLKYKLYITASSFHNVRVVFWLQRDPTVPANWQNCYHKVVQIEGDTTVEFTIPYTSPHLVESVWRMYLWCETLAWSVPDSALTVPVYINVYKAGASDVRFGIPLDTQLVVQSNPRADFQENFPMFHDAMTGYSTSGYVYGEEYTSLRQLVHRPCPTYAPTSASVPVWNTSATLYGPELYGAFYRFWRGSVRFKLVSKTDKPKAVDLSIGNTVVRGSTVSSSTNPVLEVECPFYFDGLFRSTNIQTNDYVLNYSLDTGGSVYIVKSVGDDFSFHFLRYRPTTLTKIPNSGTVGQMGLVSYLKN